MIAKEEFGEEGNWDSGEGEGRRRKRREKEKEKEEEERGEETREDRGETHTCVLVTGVDGCFSRLSLLAGCCWRMQKKSQFKGFGF